MGGNNPALLLQQYPWPQAERHRGHAPHVPHAELVPQSLGDTGDNRPMERRVQYGSSA